jgi:hypothetical protein
LMEHRPSYLQVRNAIARGVCPWCSTPTEGLSSDICPQCGHNIRAARGPRDPGSPGIASLCSILALVLIIAVAIIQQNVESLIAQKAGPAAAASIEPPSGQFELTAKIFAKIQAFYGDPSLPTAKDPKMHDELGTSAVKTLEGQAGTDLDRLRVAMFAGEVKSADDAIKRLDALQPNLPAGSPLIEDCTILRALYAGETVNAEGQMKLETNHGWLGRLAVTHGKPDTDPERALLVGGGAALMAALLAAGGGLILVLIAAFVCFIVAIVKLAGGTLSPRFIPPSPGGSIAIEMVVIFVLGFLALKALSLLAEQVLGPHLAIWFSLAAQWSLLFILLWPRLRGAKKGLAGLGWTTGQGVLTEMGCGIFGYLACLPMVVVGALIYQDGHGAQGTARAREPDLRDRQRQGRPGDRDRHLLPRLDLGAHHGGVHLPRRPVSPPPLTLDVVPRRGRLGPGFRPYAQLPPAHARPGHLPGLWLCAHPRMARLIDRVHDRALHSQCRSPGGGADWRQAHRFVAATTSATSANPPSTQTGR